ncbi:Type II secretion system protein E [Novipirellula aureliae]|uniref:Type II secretion system protein E n=1 Tax=Novipirellula aureliae TaxID=2527966 RepID=A0A5C6E2A2_9BACT|nr:ATPase, T2SS/T4P/T4SS family [Novipirellula aureliae]TWU42988.1 Type II secretion system protein E [Novipirellula aureliae]
MLINRFADLDPETSDFAVKVVERLVPYAIEAQASDIHLQPRGDVGWEVLFRIDGVLAVVDTIKASRLSDPVARLMVLASLPTYRSSQPMEGRLNWPTAASSQGASSKGALDPSISMRLGVFPTVHGPRAVIRLLRQNDRYDRVESLGMSDFITAELVRLSQQTDGAILISGPTGSGKTTTLYAMLREIAASNVRRSVLTIEDPIESIIDSISQSELDPSGGMTLASALRSAVRQDSEVLLVSEIRDPETAEAVIQASMTGHLVFSTLHASDVASTLRRFVQFGTPTFALRSGLTAVLSQRLLRRRCTHCRGVDGGLHSEQTKCGECLGSRYQGRIAIACCHRFDGSDPAGEAMADALEAGGSVAKMQAASKEAGATSLREVADELVQKGITDQAEVYRVLGRCDFQPSQSDSR